MNRIFDHPHSITVEFSVLLVYGKPHSRKAVGGKNHLIIKKVFFFIVITFNRPEGKSGIFMQNLYDLRFVKFNILSRKTNQNDTKRKKNSVYENKIAFCTLIEKRKEKFYVSYENFMTFIKSRGNSLTQLKRNSNQMTQATNTLGAIYLRLHRFRANVMS